MPVASPRVTIGTAIGPEGIECGTLILALNGRLHKLSMPSSMAAASAAAMMLMLFTACGVSPTQTTNTRFNQRLGKLDQLTEKARILERKIDATGEVSPNFLAQYQATLKAAAATVHETTSRDELISTIEQVGQQYSIGRWATLHCRPFPWYPGRSLEPLQQCRLKPSRPSRPLQGSP